MKDLTKPAGRKETPAEIAAYRVAVDSASIRNIRLVYSQFQAQPEATSLDREGWTQGFECVTAETHYDPKKKIISAIVDAEAFCRLGRRKIISVKCKYIVSYNVSGEPDDDAANRFAGHVGRFAAYPYFRAHFAELTTQAGLLLPPLPIMKEGKRIIGKSDAEPVATP